MKIQGPSSLLLLTLAVVALSAASPAAAAAAGSGSAAAAALRGRRTRGDNAHAEKVRTASGGPRSLMWRDRNPLNCVYKNTLKDGQGLTKGDGVCSGTNVNDSIEFGLSKEGALVLWRHDYRTNQEILVWKDPSGSTGSFLNLEVDGSLVMYVVSPQGGAEIRVGDGNGGFALWSVSADGVATSPCA
jgi:hypothetical protein